jgi:hypothetical protein
VESGGGGVESSSNPILDGHLHYPDDIHRPLNEAATDKIRDYRTDYNNRPSNSISFMPSVASTSGRLHCKLVRLFFLQAHDEPGKPKCKTSLQWRLPEVPTVATAG